MQATMIAGSRRVSLARAPRRAASVPVRSTIVRVQTEVEPAAPSASAPEAPKGYVATVGANGEVTGPSGSLDVLSPVQEAINGRAAMLGFVAAVLSEALTHQAVWSQIAGRYDAAGELLEAPIGQASLLFAAVVALTTMATLVPKMVYSEEVDARSFGPFTPGLEKTLGRVAQMGFAGLLVVELARGSALLG
ncbi:hypothetical protein HYH03_014435 [Edaphochlamys debaryana]|uniref:Uncharacterized protein n=1 Tax=Edaphochlamys debaryana TaxID=47281 RepID=A0A835XRJ0_9CHLO|nr:hypothetical protein HYH03_014435 [Edaphochlamys debaryana]|eukprot:KAG2486936.1 hypothetical protein HYH03_014435 [Edaphochlamys debaryana]